MRPGLRNYRRMRHRMTMYRFPNRLTLIDDSYSSNPHAAKAAIDTLAQMPAAPAATRIAVLGAMAALGAYAARGHREVGRHLAKKKISQVYTYGALAKQIGTAAVQAGLAPGRVRHFTSKAALHSHLLRTIQPNTVILVKASHSIGLMETADFLRSRLGKKAFTG
ncbi:glutamate ligase domain-containing protein [Alicyclobacillus contaminans]|uniref:glutamate ligase domain-containing protein n=1 Tax=Alicyclobacillus contaminans TaxID=392016 RepID=UPI001FDF8C54|nr:cyanophycin synthetase [Alicyclobacillus contaminans]